VSWWAVLLVAVALLAGNAFFVAVEFALLAARQTRVERMVEEGRFGAPTALRQMRSLNLQLATCQLGITVMSLLLGWLVEPSIGHVVEGWVGASPIPPAVGAVLGVAIALVIVAFFHMVLGEMVPKSVALTAPERVATVLAPLQRGVVLLVRPVVVVLDRLSRWGTRLLRVESTDELTEAHSPNELAAILSESAQGGELQATEHVLLSGAIGYLGGRVADHLTPRSELVTVPTTATVREAEELIHRSGHSRVLVTTEGSDEVAGFLHAKDLLRLDPGQRDGLLPNRVVIAPVRVAPDEPLADVLVRMRERRRHVAVVAERTDRPGAPGPLVGLITLEDVLEAIVGDIRDESDRRTGRS
jgi:CBS domain containing-hemolysin-like protein